MSAGQRPPDPVDQYGRRLTASAERKDAKPDADGDAVNERAQQMSIRERVRLVLEVVGRTVAQDRYAQSPAAG
jgi:hypothetical protein